MNQTFPYQSQHYHFGRGGKDAEHQAHQADIQSLLAQHTQLSRQVELLSNGFSAITTSDNPELVTILQRHVFDMKTRFAKGRAIRSWDAVYALLFAYRDQIEVTYEQLDNGVSSVVTTDQADLVEVLHAHAQAVSRFVQQGKEAAAESYPLSTKALEKLTNTPHN
jgi:hypothetical protein